MMGIYRKDTAGVDDIKLMKRSIASVIRIRTIISLTLLKKAHALKVYTVSDIHVDHKENLRKITDISQIDYQKDILIVAGDISSRLDRVRHVFSLFKERFREVLFVPGNHDLWVRDKSADDSIEKFDRIMEMAAQMGVLTQPAHFGSLSVIPFLGWYDYSFGSPSEKLSGLWMDHKACAWPDGFDERRVTDFFIEKNQDHLKIKNRFIITFSHFLPRIDIMPSIIPKEHQKLYPVLGSARLEAQIREINSDIHVFGHSHVNLKKEMDGTVYINNAFGYPYEKLVTGKKLLFIHEM